MLPAAGPLAAMLDRSLVEVLCDGYGSFLYVCMFFA